jgi:hypothetical protein
MPMVFRGPYEYSSPESSDDYWMQTAPPESRAGHAEPAPAGD